MYIDVARLPMCCCVSCVMCLCVHVCRESDANKSLAQHAGRENITTDGQKTHAEVPKGHRDKDCLL